MNKDLHLLLDSMVRQAKQGLRNTGQVAPFVAILTSQQKISFLLAPVQSANHSLQNTMRTLEAGLRARIGQGLSSAIGTCLGTTPPEEPMSVSQHALQMFLEHLDGTAYRITMPCANRKLEEASQAAAVIAPGTQQFFLKVMTRSA